jgi:hypothetical protein
MVTHKPTFLTASLPGLLIALLCASSIHADPPKVTAVLSNSSVALGQVVQLQIRVVGANEARIPQEIAIDGLEIHPTGTSRQFEMRNFETSSTVTYNYTILPMKSGTFKIPPQTIRVGSTSLQTPELQLNVADSGGAVGSGNAGRARTNPATQPQAAPGKAAFAEMIVTKKSAYVGEMVPVEIRLGFYSRARARPLDTPEITGQGFTMQKLQQVEQARIETINGISYDVLTFKTAIAAARPGKLEIGPAQANALVAVPRGRGNSSRSRSPFDIFNMDDPFSDPFFADPFGSFGQQEKVTIKSEPATLEVKALPKNAPPDFSGAVGNFTMTVDGNPKNVQVGDPITVKASIAGRGNFDRVSAPVLEDERGWHKYPPSSKFQQDDDVGISGTKTFESVLSPNENKKAIPPFGFAYFDPLKEQYVNLKSDPIAIRAEGGSAPPVSAAAPSVAATSAVPATPSPAQAAVKPADILYQLTQRPQTVESFTPLYARRAFWLAQLIPLLALGGFIGWKVRRARLQNREAIRAATLQHEAANLMRKLRRDNALPRDYYADAARAVQLKTALATKSDPTGLDAEAAARVFHLDEKARATLRELFERNDELRYSGRPNGFETIAPEERREVLDLIETLRA